MDAAKKKKLMDIAGVALVAVLAGVGVWMAMDGGKEASQPEKAHIQNKPQQSAPKPEMPKNVEKAPQATAEVDARAEFREKLKAMTPEERAEFLLQRIEETPIDLEPTSNQVFRTGTEQVMSWIFTTRLGDAPPPMPRLPVRDELHMAEILQYSTPVFEDDSEATKAAKETVNQAKEELRKFIQEGGDVKDFLEYYNGQLRQAYEEWRESRNSILQVIREDPGIAQEYISEVNARLEAKGIKPVTISPKLLEKFGVETY